MRSSRGKSAFAVVALTLAVILVALPASAAPPESIHTDVQMDFDILAGTMHGEGAWSSKGLVNSSGDAQEDHFVAGWPPGYLPKTAHLGETWADADGTITIQIQLNVGGWTIVSFPCEVHYEATGHSVIESATGVYENLKGERAVTSVGDITPDSCSPLKVTLSVTETYEGIAHFAP
jgi:hypothetical protein